MTRIDDWTLVPGPALVGRVSNHPRQKEFKSEYQQTSNIVCTSGASIHHLKMGDFVTTESGTVYELGVEERG